MEDAPRRNEERRRAFLEAPPPTPFFKTPEGRRFAFILFASVLALGGLLWQYKRLEARIERDTAQREQAAAAQQPTSAQHATLEEKRAALETAFEGAFRDTQNGDDFIETAGYHKLIEILASTPPQEITRRAGTYLDYATALREPDLLRGDWVRMRGLIGGLFAVKLERPEHDVTDVWRGSLSQPDGESEAIVFDLIGDPPQLDKRRTVVEIDGLFYRTLAYEAKDLTHKTAPYLLVRNVRVIEEVPKGGGPRYLAIAIGLGVIAAYFILRASARSKRRGPSQPRIKDLFEQQRRAARAQDRT